MADTFDSREYEWADITLILGGRDVTGIRAVKYKEKAEKELLYAKGRLPRSIQTGNIAYEGEITLLQSELDALLKSGKGSLLGLSLDAEVHYGNPAEGIALTTDRLVGLQFSESGKEAKQGDKFQEVALPVLFIRLKSGL